MSAITIGLVGIALVLCVFDVASVGGEASASLSAALCQVVYPLDQFPKGGDYHYTFFGNAFFINDEGYLITAGHVISAFRDGGRPHVIVGRPNEPRQLLEATVVATDWEHDVAILRATPNPFLTGSNLAYLPLAVATPSKGTSVVDASLLSSDVENVSSLTPPLEKLSQGEVLDYQFHYETGAPGSEVLLVSQTVSPGQSGSPLVSADSHGVVGIVVGRWLFPVVVRSEADRSHVTLSPGAALRIHYAISLLQKNHVAWHPAEEPAWRKDPRPRKSGLVAPVPVSVVGTSYPPQALFGGDVLLDVLIDSSGKPAEIKVVSGHDPFVDPAVSAVRTWTFQPAALDGQPADARIGIVFQFPQSFIPSLTSKENKHREPLAESGSDEQGALPVFTVEPNYPVNTVVQGDVALYSLLDSEGHITSTSTLLDLEPLTASTIAAVQKWQFVPAKHAGVAVDSAVVVVEIFRRRSN